MSATEKRFVSLMRRVYTRSHARSERDFADRQHDFAFHMVDAADDVMAYAELLRNPAGFTVLQAQRVVNGIIHHAVGHLMAASRLYAGSVQDQFEGAPLYVKRATKARRAPTRSRARARG